MPGLFVPGESLLHRLDPRCKLVCLPMYVASCFVLNSFALLSVLVVLCVLLLHLGSISVVRYVRFLLSLRYLFVFTLLVYLFFTPGHTLLGVAWLSRDGLWQGGVVCLQLSLALGFSMLVSSTTSPTALATGIEQILRPLRHLGVPVTLISDSLQLVMYFVDSMMTTVAETESQHGSGATFRQRMQGRVAIVGMLLESSLERADLFAAKLSRGESLGLGTEADLEFGFGWPEWCYLVVTFSTLGVLLGALG